MEIPDALKGEGLWYIKLSKAVSGNPWAGAVYMTRSELGQ